MPEKLVRQVDAHAKYLTQTTGMAVNRTDAVRALLTEALEKQLEKQGKKRG
ncbi:MAG: hypothetical protein AMXMBFR56_61750 [Polyangiaceae bacterium]